MQIQLYRSYLADTVIEEVGTVTQNEAGSSDSGSDFTLNYKDVEPGLIIQMLNDSGDPIDLSPPPQGSNFTLTSALAFTATLQNQINSTTNLLTSTYDARFDLNSILSIDEEIFYVIGVSHDRPNNISSLRVDTRSSNSDVHYMGTPIRVIRTKPSIRIFDAVTGKLKITWQQTDTNMPGEYDLEITLSRPQGSSLVRWSIYPIRIVVTSDYDLK
jgi:hypothetical protein